MNRRTFLRLTTSSLLGAGFLGCSARTPQRAGKRPNILLAIADDASYPHMSAYGTPWVHTPGFDRVASAGLLFNRAYTPNAKCAPSRACILTGRNSWQLEAAANHWCYFPEKFTTYAEVLSQNGYHVGYTAKGWAPGVPGEKNGQPRQLTGKPYDEHTTTPPAKYISNNDYSANFADFLAAKPDDEPFCFWYGGREPHRRYEYGAGVRKGGKNPADVDRVFPFFPDNETVRTDMLDYAFEIEYFDSHLQKMLALLEETGELDNTLVVVTGDNGMPFPRIKGQEYEYSNHLPLAIMWKDGIVNPGRTIDDFVNFIDLAPTFLELARVNGERQGMQPITGHSLTNIFFSRKSGVVNPDRDHILIGKERHDVGRPHDWGYPIRGIVTDEYLYLHNFKTDRWPAGPPQTGYLNCDGSPTKTIIIKGRKDPATHKYWEWSFDKRPADEFYHIASDKDCTQNLADDPQYADVKNRLHDQLFAELKQQQDPRVLGNGDVFDEYLYADKAHRNFYERYMNGEKLNAGWVNPSDFEPDFPE